MDTVLTTLAIIGGFFVFGSAASRVGYNTDEGQFIAQTGFYDLAFERHDLTNVAWGVNYHALTQPMLSRFILGAGIRAAGFERPPLNLRYREPEVNPATRAKYLERDTYRDERKLAEERKVDRPSDSVLRAARAPMVVLGALGIGLMYIVGRLAGGPLTGIVTAVWVLANPTFQTLIPRAHAEAPLFFFSAAAIVLMILAARRVPDAWSIGLGAASGAMAGLAASSKLTGLLLSGILAVYAGIALAIWIVTRSRDSAVAWRWSTIALLTSVVIFLVANPFLYPDPVGRFRDMLAFRQQEMFGQAALSEAAEVAPGLTARLPYLLDRTLLDLGTLTRRLIVPLDVPLAAIGLLGLIIIVARSGLASGVLGEKGIVLITVVVVTLGIAVNLGIDWARYYMPVLTMAAITVGLGISLVISGLRRLAHVT